jgi:hypothetical protein
LQAAMQCHLAGDGCSVGFSQTGRSVFTDASVRFLRFAQGSGFVVSSVSRIWKPIGLS